MLYLNRWSYGILLWEILTIGELLLMKQCWKENPAERPSFTVIREQLELMMLQHCPYLDTAGAQYSYAAFYDSDSDNETQMESTAL